MERGLKFVIYVRIGLEDQVVVWYCHQKPGYGSAPK